MTNERDHGRDRPFQVCLYVDDHASWSSTPESEYEDLEYDLRAKVFGAAPVSFRTGVPPADVPPDCDVYVVDYGAITAAYLGREFEARRLTAQLIARVRETPSCYFLVWSSMTASYFHCALADELDADCLEDGQVPPNVLLYPRSDETGPQFERLRALLGLGGPLPEPAPQVRVAKRGPVYEDPEADADDVL